MPRIPETSCPRGQSVSYYNIVVCVTKEVNRNIIMMSSLSLRQLILSTSRRPQNVIARQRLCTDCYNASLARSLPHTRRTHSRALASEKSSSLPQRCTQPLGVHPQAQLHLSQQTHRGMATTRASSQGPMGEYDARVRNGRLRDDQHQRSTRSLAGLPHHVLIAYRSTHSEPTRSPRYAPRLQTAESDTPRDNRGGTTEAVVAFLTLFLETIKSGTQHSRRLAERCLYVRRCR